MKIKDAIIAWQKIPPSDNPKNDTYKFLMKIYESEVRDRVNLRAHGKVLVNSSDQLVIEATGKGIGIQGVIISVIDEVESWMKQLMNKIGYTDPQDQKLVLTQRGFMFAEYRVEDPKVEAVICKVRIAMSRGGRLLDGLTGEGLEAIGNMMLGEIVHEAREYKKLQNSIEHKGTCPIGVEARTCPNQESTTNKSRPTSVDDITFDCMINPKDCKWSSQNEALAKANKDTEDLKAKLDKGLQDLTTNHTFSSDKTNG